MRSSDPVERMSAIILAKSIVDRREVLTLRGGISAYLAQLSEYGLFTVGEMAEFANVSEYQVRKASESGTLLRAKSGVHTRHLDFLLRMVDNNKFSRIHTKGLVDDGATVQALSRVTGHAVSSLKRWSKEERDDD